MSKFDPLSSENLVFEAPGGSLLEPLSAQNNYEKCLRLEFGPGGHKNHANSASERSWKPTGVKKTTLDAAQRLQEEFTSLISGPRGILDAGPAGVGGVSPARKSLPGG